MVLRNTTSPSGERRANAVKMYLQGKGVSADQISIVSYGKEKPAVLGHDEAAYSKKPSCGTGLLREIA